MNFCIGSKNIGKIEGRLVFGFFGFSWFYEVLFTQRTSVEYREG